MVKRLKPIPEFKTVQEESEFWETHSPLDFPEYWKESKVKVAKPLKHTFISSSLTAGISIDLAPKVVRQMKKFSEKMQISPADLARVWITERLEMLRPTR